jgi:hypothetical protein
MKSLSKKMFALLAAGLLLGAVDFTSARSTAIAQTTEIKVSVDGPWGLIDKLVCPPEKLVCKQRVCVPGACISFRKDCTGGKQAVCDAQNGN